MLEHFDEYYCGTGNQQRPAARSDQSHEDLAQRHRVDLGGPSAARPNLVIGMKPEQPLVGIDLAEPAAIAARQLAAVVGFLAGGQVLSVTTMSVGTSRNVSARLGDDFRVAPVSQGTQVSLRAAHATAAGMP